MTNIENGAAESDIHHVDGLESRTDSGAAEPIRWRPSVRYLVWVGTLTLLALIAAEVGVRSGAAAIGSEGFGAGALTASSRVVLCAHLVLTAVPLLFVDFRERLLPYRLLWPYGASVLLVLSILTVGEDVRPGRFAEIVIASLAVAAIFLTMAFFGALGLADVWLSVPLVASVVAASTVHASEELAVRILIWVGCASLLAIPHAVVNLMRARRRSGPSKQTMRSDSAVAFGPYLVAAAGLMVILQR